MTEEEIDAEMADAARRAAGMIDIASREDVNLAMKETSLHVQNIVSMMLDLGVAPENAAATIGGALIAVISQTIVQRKETS
jgi:hypothetical protein